MKKWKLLKIFIYIYYYGFDDSGEAPFITQPSHFVFLSLFFSLSLSLPLSPFLFFSLSLYILFLYLYKIRFQLPPATFIIIINITNNRNDRSIMNNE